MTYSADESSDNSSDSEDEQERFCVPNMDLKPTTVTASFQEQQRKVRHYSNICLVLQL